MTTLREAAQQALEALEHATPTTDWSYMITALRAALAQQAEPLNLRDPAVQKRLATQWGYVPAAQAEPVEPVAWLAPDGSVRETPAAKSFGEWVWGPDDFKPLYTAPHQRKPLTEEEIVDAVREADLDWQKGWTLDETQSNRFVTLARAVERARGIKE